MSAEKRATRNSKDIDAHKAKDEAEEKEGTKERRRKKRESRGQRGFGGGTGV